MITQNGLNLFKMALSNSLISPSDFRDINNNTDYVTEQTSVLTYYLQQSYTQGSGTPVEMTGVFRPHIRDFMPYERNETAHLNGSTISNYNTSSSFNYHTNSQLYFPEEVSTLTIPALLHTENPNMLAQFNQDGIRFCHPLVRSGTATTNDNMQAWQPLGVYGLSPDEDEYMYITIPKGFQSNSQRWLNVYGKFSGGLAPTSIIANLGYSSDAESIDDYDLKSPVYNKKLCPLTIKWESNNGTITITVAFKNSEAESITVNEFGIYCTSQINSDRQRLNPTHTVSMSGYKVGFGSTGYYDTNKTLGDYVYITRGISPNLIVRKVLPQAVTIPADGVATFKYTIDLSEMQAQENITYSEEE